jgi:hypothetical protein
MLAPLATLSESDKPHDPLSPSHSARLPPSVPSASALRVLCGTFRNPNSAPLATRNPLLATSTSP